MEMSRLTRDGTAEPVSRNQFLRRERGQGNIHFPCSADHEQDWQPYPVDTLARCVTVHTQYLLFLTLQGKETDFRGHKQTQNKVQKKEKEKKDPEKILQ